jgi:putative ABC transport system permease protein
MNRLALASLRHRLAAFVATFLAVLVGSALLVACGGLFESGLRSAAVPQRLAGADLVVTGPQGFKLPDQESETVPYAERPGVAADRVADIRSIPGVEDAWVDVSFPAVVAGTEPGTVLSGHDWASAGMTPYTLTGSAPADGEVVLDAAAGKRIGDRVDLVVAGAPETFTVSGIATPDTRVDAAALFFSTGDVARFTPHPDTADLIGVRVADGASVAEVAGQLPAGLTVLTDDDRGAAEFAGVTASTLPLILLSSIFGGMVMVVMALVVWATISLSVRQRQQELALLRATGATPAQVRSLVVTETTVVAGIAVVFGVALGAVVGEWVFEASASRGVIPSTLEFRQGPIPFAAGVVLGMLTPWLAARFAAGAAARTRPIQALAEAAIPSAEVSPLRRLLAMIFAVGTVGLTVSSMFLDADTASAVGGPAVLTGSIAVALYGPELVTLLVDRCSAVLRRVFPRHGQLVVINTRARAVQFAAVLTPITLATAIALGNIYSQTTHDDALLDTAVDQFQADAVVSSSAGGIPPELVESMRDTEGVTAVSGLVFSSGWLEEPYDEKGSDPSPFVGIDAPDVLATPVTAGSLADLRGDAVALDEDQADDLGLSVGSPVTLRLGDATQAKVRVVALLEDSPSVVVPASLLAPHTMTGLPSKLLVRGASDLEVRDFPGVTVAGPDALAAEFERGLGVQAWINYLLAILAMAYAAIASVNTLAVAVLSRRREFAAQRLAGATRREVAAMLSVEAVVIGAAGLVLGTVIALCTVLPMAVAVGAFIPSGPLWVFPATAAAILAIVYPVTRVTAGLAMRRRAIDAVTAA